MKRKYTPKAHKRATERARAVPIHVPACDREGCGLAACYGTGTERLCEWHFGTSASGVEMYIGGVKRVSQWNEES